MSRPTRAQVQMAEIRTAVANLRAEALAEARAEARAELAAQGQVVGGRTYESRRRAAMATATTEVQGVGHVQTGAGSAPIDDRGQLIRQARGRRGWKTEGDPRDGRQTEIQVVATRARLARLAQEQEQAAAIERGRQVQEQQTRATQMRQAGDDRMAHERTAAQLRGLEADRQAWAASVRHQAAEGARRAEADLRAALGRDSGF